MGFDFFAIATHGFYPTPTPTMRARMAFAVTWGYINIGIGYLGSSPKGLGRLGMCLATT